MTPLDHSALATEPTAHAAALPADAPEPPFDRQAASLLSRLNAALPHGAARLIGLVSPPGAPAPTGAADALAMVAAAELGRRTLLIDASADHAVRPQGGGLSLAGAWLTGCTRSTTIAVNPACPSLSHALLCGTATTLTQLGGIQLRQLLTQLGDEFGTIIVDAGAADPGGIAEQLCGNLAGSVLVVRARIDTEQAVRAGCARLRSAGGQLLGTVLIQRAHARRRGR